MSKRVYIAGPMTGKPAFNFPAFDAAKREWQRAGWIVVSPADLTRDYWRAHFGEEFDVDNPDPRSAAGGDIYREFLRVDVGEIARCDAIALLPGWKASRGVAKELIVARVLGLAEYDAITLERMQFGEMPPRDGVFQQPILPTDATARKAVPLCSGVLDYFPAALAEVARVSKHGNDQHNLGESLHWARGKSMDQADTIARHLLERGGIDVDGQRHSAKLAWRALALLQLELETDGAPLARGAKPATGADA